MSKNFLFPAIIAIFGDDVKILTSSPEIVSGSLEELNYMGGYEFTALMIGAFLAETVKNIGKGSANSFYENANSRFRDEIIGLKLNESSTAETITKQLEAKPEILESVQRKLDENPEFSKKLRDSYKARTLSMGQSGGQTAHQITNNYYSEKASFREDNEQELTVEVKERTNSKNPKSTTKSIFLKLENISDKKLANLTTYVDMVGVEAFHRLPLLVKYRDATSEPTTINLYPREKVFIDLLFWRDHQPQIIKFTSPSAFRSVNTFELPSDEKVEITIMVRGDIKPLDKNYFLFLSEGELQIEEKIEYVDQPKDQETVPVEYDSYTKSLEEKDNRLLNYTCSKILEFIDYQRFPVSFYSIEKNFTDFTKYNLQKAVDKLVQDKKITKIISNSENIFIDNDLYMSLKIQSR